MITTNELAKLAGVSQSTVSRCLNDHPSISYKTKERVRKLALQYGYAEEKAMHKTILSKKHRIIGILVEEQPFFDNLFIHYTINKLIEEAAAKNYYTIYLPFSSHNNGTMEKLEEFMKANTFDGFIIMHRRYDDMIHEYLTEQNIPHIYLLHCSRDFFETVNIIDTDNYMGGYLGTRHLLNHGHTKIITLTCPWREFEDRTNGYIRALKTQGIKKENEFILTCDCTYQSAYNLVLKHSDLFSKCTAVFVQSDIMTLGVVNALHQLGLRIPEDISIVGSDGYELGTFSSPQFDSVAHPISDLTRFTISRLIEMISNPHVQTPHQILLKPHILERGSVKSISNY